MSDPSAQTTTDSAAAPAPAAPAPAPAPAAAPAPSPAPASSPAAAPASAPAPAAAPAPAPAADSKPADAPPGAPEKYEFQKTEGIALDEKVLAKYSEVAKSLNMPQDAAQKLLSEVAPAIAQQQADAFKATVEGWKTQTTADKEIGGEKLSENLGLAKRAMDAYFSADFVKLLNDSGLGNHPEMIRGLMKAGRLVSQDRFVAGGSGSSNQGKSAADILYGSR